jgi:hypothetical protein
MPCVVYISLKSVLDLARSFFYCGSAGHPNHDGYTVEAPRVYGVPSAQAFLEKLAYALLFLNGERGPSHQLTVAARWWVMAFKVGSYPTPKERDAYEAVLVQVLGCYEWYASSWHLHKNGSCDLNIFDTGIDFTGALPHLRRSRRINLLGRARAASDNWSLQVNTSRSERGEAPIPTPILFHEGRRKERGEQSIEELLAVMGGIRKLDHKTLPKALEKIGLKTTEWKISMCGRFLELDRIPGRAKRKGQRTIRITISTLFESVNLKIRMIEVISEPQGADLEAGEKVIRTQWTAIDVIQPTTPSPVRGM